jgi:transposase
MSQRWRKFPPEFRREALEKMKHCASVSELARQLGIRRKWLYEWKKAASAGPQPEPQEPVQSPQPAPRAEQPLRRRIAELEALTARQSLELDFFKGALQRIEERRRKREQTSAAESTGKSGK